MTFSFEIKETQGYRVIHLRGKLVDKNQASDLINEIDFLLGSNVNKFVIDLSDVEYLNSSGLGILINILTLTRNAGGEVIITNIPEKIRQLFLVTKLNTVFQVTDSSEEAIKLLGSPEETLDQ